MANYKQKLRLFFSLFVFGIWCTIFFDFDLYHLSLNLKTPAPIFESKDKEKNWPVSIAKNVISNALNFIYNKLIIVKIIYKLKNVMNNKIIQLFKSLKFVSYSVYFLYNFPLKRANQYSYCFKFEPLDETRSRVKTINRDSRNIGSDSFLAQRGARKN